MKKVKVTWLKADGSRMEEIRRIPKESDFADAGEYAEIRDFLGGPLEYVTLVPGRKMFYCHEEGKYEGLPFNEAATVIFYEAHGHMDPIAGNVVMFEAVR